MEAAILFVQEFWAFIVGGSAPIFVLIYFLLKPKKTKPVLNDLGKKEATPKVASPIQVDTKSEQPQKRKDSAWGKAFSNTRNKFAFKLNQASAENLKEELEEACITSDLGVTNTDEALENIPWAEVLKKNKKEQVNSALNSLSKTITPWLHDSHQDDKSSWPFNLHSEPGHPIVIWFVGVNGVGKTTTIAKLASEITKNGKTCLFACGDTFRAAASDQLETWAERLKVPCVKGAMGSDSSAVLFDAIESAKSKNIDFVLCDSAGRLHNNNQLMESLAKNKRVMSKALESAPHEVILVLDGNTGQNMLNQTDQFLDNVGVTSLILTKLDGTAKGGAVVAVSRKTGLPIRRLGLGEKVEDFVPFNSKLFVKSLLGLEEINSNTISS